MAEEIYKLDEEMYQFIHKQCTRDDFISEADGEERLKRVFTLTNNKFTKPNLFYSSNLLYSFLSKAVKNKHTEFAKQLLISCTKIKSDNEEPFDTPLHFAVQNNDVEVAEMLLDSGVDVNAKGTAGIIFITPMFFEERKGIFTSLHFAIKNGNKEMIKLLLSRGANVNSKLEDCMPLYTALGTVYPVSPEIVEILLKFGADIDSKDKYGNTVLYYAIEHRHPDVVKILLNFGASIDSEDNSGVTALYLACKLRNIRILRTFLEYVSDINFRHRKNDCTPLEFTIVQICSYYNKLVACYTNSCPLIFPVLNYTDTYCICADIIDILKQHTIKMITVNLYVSKKSLLSISKLEEELAKMNSKRFFINNEINIKDFQNKCEVEIANMKNEKVNNVSFFNILTKNINKLAIYAGNESIVQALRSDDYKIKFPIYASMINSHYRKGERRKKLLEQSNKIFHYFFNNFRLPQECTEKIFSYLNNNDLRILMDAY